MTSRIWTGGHDGNDAGSAANWSPNGSPQPGDDLNVVTGTLEINGPNSLAGNTLHLNDPAVGVGPVVLDMNGWGARAAIDGSLQAGDQLIINAIGQDYLDATGGVEHGASSGGSINLADHAHLYVTGTMHFGYGGALTGGIGSLLTNYGRINLGSSNIPADFPGLVSPVSGTVSVLVNGDGTLVFRGYHNAYGYASISAPITAAQTVECNPGYDGMLLTLSDPGDFHALLSIDPTIGQGDVSVRVTGVHADSFAVFGDKLFLINAGRAVDVLHVANDGSLQITPTYGTDVTTLTFHTG